MSSTSLEERRIDAVSAGLRRCDAVQAADPPGSAATNRLRADSDVDIAILPRWRHGLLIEESRPLTADVARILGRSVDLGVLSTANVVYATEAVATGRLLRGRDRGMTARYAMLASSMPASPQEARREVLRAHAA